MNAPIPHYLLFSEADRPEGSGCWSFRIQQSDGTALLEATDVEPDVQGERLKLLTVIRGLEALDQPSRVTLIGCGEYVRRGMEQGLPEWRENDWRWERFGQMVAIRNDDLWRRLDRAMQIHEVECRWRRLDSAHDNQQGGPHDGQKTGSGKGNKHAGNRAKGISPRRGVISLITSISPWIMMARRCMCELHLRCKTLGNWLKEDTRTRSSCLARTK